MGVDYAFVICKTKLLQSSAEQDEINKQRVSSMDSHSVMKLYSLKKFQ